MRDGLPLAITPGEPAGIGPECVLRLAARGGLGEAVVLADPGLLERTATRLGLSVTIEPWRPGQALPSTGLACRSVPLAREERVGFPEPQNAAYVLDCLREAVDLVRQGHCHALVTGPVHKGIINDAGIPFSGHTEFLAGLAGRERVVMLLAAADLRVALVTTYFPGASPQRVEELVTD